MALDPAARALVRSDCYIDGAWRASAARFAVRDPATDEVLADVPDLGPAAIDDAVAAAARAWPAWRARSAYDRAAVLSGLAARMRAEQRALAALITAENGKPLAEAAGEVAYAASFLEWFAGEAVRVYGETIPATAAGQRIEVSRAPVGPCALITPWNFPAAMLTRKLGAALAVGCTVVCKPAEATPLTALALAGFAHDLGVPAGVINVVTGDGPRIGGQLVAAPGIRKVSFTGSTAVGRSIARACADGPRRVSLELGGNAPFVILDDADLDRALAGALVAKFRNAGQSCVAANRFIVARALGPAFTDRIAAAAAALIVADGRTPGAQLGPLIDRRAVAKVRRLVEDALARGARLVTGAVPAEGARFVAPIVLADVGPEMAVWREEIFGPVVAIRACADDDDAIAQANDTDAGLVGYVFGRDAARLRRVTAALEVGMVGVNEGLVSTAQAPFGGIKASGLGREGSRHGLDDYTDLKYVLERV
jgi:succinate-semialdehyde dehydrogenase/glutarate-semialdehyde dehydrogenase